MSFSSSGAVATLLSPSNYSGTTKMPVPSTVRRYSTTSSTSSYRTTTTGNPERPILSSTTGLYPSASRSIHTEYHFRSTPLIRPSNSVPKTYPRYGDIRDTSTRITSKSRSEVSGNSFPSYSRSKTENDVAAASERCSLKTDSYKSRADPTSSSLLNTSKLDLKYSLKYSGGSSLHSTSTGLSSSLKSSKISDYTSRLHRRDSLTKSSDNAETSPSPMRSLDRKSSSSVSGVSSSTSPIEIRKSSEVWNYNNNITTGSNKRLSGSYESAVMMTMKECFEGDNDDSIRSQPKLASRENSGDLSESSIILESIEAEEKTLSFAEIRRKFNNNSDLSEAKGGTSFEGQKSSHSKDSKSPSPPSSSSGFANGSHADRKYKKSDEVEDSDVVYANSVDSVDIDSNISFPSPQTLHGLLLKRVPSNLKSNLNLATNTGCNNNINYTNPRKSPDPLPDSVSNSIKKRSLPDLKKSILSPEKKEPNAAKLREEIDSKLDEQKLMENKRESRKSIISATLGMEGNKIQPKRKGEKLQAKVEQTLSKTAEKDVSDVLHLRRSPEIKSKYAGVDMGEKKVFELRRVEPFNMSPFEQAARAESNDRRSSCTTAAVAPATAAIPSSTSKLSAEKSPQKLAKTEAGEKVLSRASPVKELVGNESPIAGRKESSMTATAAAATIGKTKKSASQKEEKESSNVRERELNKIRLFTEEPLSVADSKAPKKGDDKVQGDAVLKEGSLLDKMEIAKNYNNRTMLPGPSAYHSSNSYSPSDNLENAGIHGTSPRLNVSWNKNSNIEKGGLNGLKNIGNTCFMNSVIQCLSNTKPLLEYLLNEDYVTDINTTISSMKGALIKAFSNVIQELWAPNAEDKIINTTNFKSHVQRFAPRFMGFSQQDAQEFLRYLLEGLHEDVNRVTVKPKPITTDIDDSLSDNQKAAEAWKRYLRMDDSKVVDIFVGQLKSTLQCTSCGHCSVTFDPFWDLSLPVPNRNGQLRLSSCLDAFTKEEVLDGDEKPTCSKCKTRRKCTKSFSIQKFPKILVLHLKRFSSAERYRGKLSVTVEFPLSNLDLSPYAANRGQACTYNLYAISNHSGSVFSGHYTAYCKHPYTGNWHEYNDTGVSSLSSRSVVSGEAYVLFYELAAQTSHL